MGEGAGRGADSEKERKHDKQTDERGNKEAGKKTMCFWLSGDVLGGKEEPVAVFHVQLFYLDEKACSRSLICTCSASE